MVSLKTDCLRLGVGGGGFIHKTLNALRTKEKERWVWKEGENQRRNSAELGVVLGGV